MIDRINLLRSIQPQPVVGGVRCSTTISFTALNTDSFCFFLLFYLLLFYTSNLPGRRKLQPLFRWKCGSTLYQLQRPRTSPCLPTFIFGLGHIIALQLVSRPLSCGEDGHQLGMSSVQKQYNNQQYLTPAHPAYMHGCAYWLRRLLGTRTCRDLKRPVTTLCSRAHAPVDVIPRS